MGVDAVFVKEDLKISNIIKLDKTKPNQMKEKLDILTTEANVFSGASAALLIKTTAEHIKMCLSSPSRLRVFFGIILN